MRHGRLIKLPAVNGAGTSVGLQRDVLHLYRGFVRAAREKGEARDQVMGVVRMQFRADVRKVKRGRSTRT